MGLWQHIPFGVETLKRLQPEHVLDLSGAGRWALATRECCTAVATRSSGSAVRVEGVETSAVAIPEHVKSLYDHIHVGHAGDVLHSIGTRYDVIIIDGVLATLDKSAGKELIEAALGRGTYLLVTTILDEPIDVKGGRLSTWRAGEFSAYHLVRRCLLRDDMQRPLGSFILSKDDPKDLRTAMFDDDGAYETRGSGTLGDDAVDRVLDRVAEQAFEIAFIKKSRSYKLANAIRKQPAVRLVTRLMGKRDAEVSVEVLREHNPQSQGNEAWLLGAYLNPGEPALPWEFIDRRGEWQEKQDAAGPYGRCLVAPSGGHLTIPPGPSPELVFLTHPWSGVVRVTCNGRTEEIDLYSAQGGSVRVYPMRTPMTKKVADDKPAPVLTVQAPTGPVTRTRSAAQEAFIAKARASGASVVAVHCPRWLGVTNSTKNLFEHLYPVPETPSEEPYHLTDETLAEYARPLLECGAKTFVFSGGDEAHYRLMKIMAAAKPGLRFIMLWHGNYVQLSDDYAFRTLKLWIDAAREGLVECIGTVKAGMEEFFESQGVRSKFVMNYIRGSVPPATPPKISAAGTHLGLWMSGTLWKTPNVMLAAAKLIPNAKIHTAGIDVRSRELIDQYGIATGFASTKPLPFDELMRRMRDTHLTMYVTFTECCPMIPLESFSQGVPAIVGPNSHLFQDDDFLRERLVVPFPDRADTIAKAIRKVVEERDAIVARYAAYAPGYNERSRQSVEALFN
jgi:hypothetical protein